MNQWYDNINKSPYTPPIYLFGIVWPILYCMIIISFITNKKYCLNCKTTYFYLIQFILNLIWTTIFFTFKKPLIALIDMLGIIIFTLLYMYNSNFTSILLLIPYILWLLFAFYLNLYIVYNN